MLKKLLMTLLLLVVAFYLFRTYIYFIDYFYLAVLIEIVNYKKISNVFSL
jgi:hypothetical protein